ncbi:hypothetical protein LCGC14_1071820 [marine sediment metagenome]|uniref:Uncharacterized protein n=1 Tax=marine sediment metagenome TaxID=412755 RepID=A0A0F9N5A4_9ZZZZ
MIRCKHCAKFVKNVVTTYYRGTATVGKVMGDCKKHGRVRCDYDDFEELGIEE